MKIRFNSTTERPNNSHLSRRIPVKKVTIPTPQSLSSFISDPRLCLSTRHEKLLRVIATGKKGRIEIFEPSEIPRLFAEGRIRLAYDGSREEGDKEYIVLDEAFEEHKFQIYNHESAGALNLIESKNGTQKRAKELFKRAEELVFDSKNKGSNLRHLSFMLREAAKAGADYLTATAIMVHNLDDPLVGNKLLSGIKKKKAWVKDVEEVLRIKQTRRRMTAIKYLPPPSGRMPGHYLQNFMDVLIKISEGNGRALLLLLVHHFSSFMRKRTASANTIRAVHELYAPLAERFGLIELAQKLKNEAFRLDKPKEYYRAENEIIETLGMSREEAGLFIDDVIDNLRNLLSPFDLVAAKGRIKKPWEAYEKTMRHKEDYPEVFFLQDILGIMGVTKKLINLEKAIEIAEIAVGHDFKAINYENNQTETKQVIINNGSKIIFHHVSIELKDGIFIEFQFMDRKSFEIRERGAKAHFAYKLKQQTGQEFDEEILEACRKEMTGYLEHDVEVVYETLKPWVYVFFVDLRYEKERVLRVIRREVGSIPLDVVSFIIGKDLTQYAGVKIRKIWESRLNPAREDRKLEDGDFLKLNPSSLGSYLTKPMRQSLASRSAKDPLTKLLLHFYGKDTEFERAAEKGLKKLRSAIEKEELRFNRWAIDDFVNREFRMNLTEFYAAVEIGILTPESVFKILAPKL